MIRIHFLILLIITGLVFGNEIKDESIEFIKTVCGDEVAISYDVYKIPLDVKAKIETQAGQSFFKDEVIVWDIKMDDSTIALGIMDNVYGKTLPITFLVIFDLEGKIMKSDVIKYREPYGGGVTNDIWQSQFEGKSKDSDFSVGDEIQAISGATISVNSLSRGVKKLTLLFESIKSHYANQTASIR